MDQDINNKIQGFLQFVFEMVEDMEKASKERNALEACKNCGTTYGNFKESGKIGCADCYKVFRLQLAQMLTNIHGSGVHKGQVPQGIDGRFADVVIKRELEESRLLLKQAVDKEEFEEAARLRDLVYKLEQEGACDNGDTVV